LKITEYALSIPGAPDVTLALAADLHCRHDTRWLAMLEQVRPDLILSSGDMMHNCQALRLDEGPNAPALAFLTEASRIAPVYYSIGNHEGRMRPENKDLLASRGITLLCNEWTYAAGLCLGGLSSTLDYGYHKWDSTPLPDHDFLDRYTASPGFHVLLCHHPEFWPRIIRGSGVALTLSGHAHGGQWNLFGKDIFAPGQGIFPRYASGMHRSDRGEVLIVSRGMANTVSPIPRLGNPTELVVIRLHGGAL